MIEFVEIAVYGKHCYVVFPTIWKQNANNFYEGKCYSKETEKAVPGNMLDQHTGERKDYNWIEGGKRAEVDLLYI